MIQSGYTKLFGSIVASTIWREDDKTRLVWITLLALSDRDGYVAASLPGLADLARVSLEDCEKALKKLQQPDKYSRSPEHEGRRIQVTEGGWLILNRAKYRDMATEEHRREIDRLRQRKHREKRRFDITRDGHGLSQSSLQKEKETENQDQNLCSNSLSEHEDSSKSTKKPHPVKVTDDQAKAIYQTYPRKVGRRQALIAIQTAIDRLMNGENGKRLSLEEALKFLREKVEAFAVSPEGNAGRYTPHPATWFNRARYSDDPSEWQRCDREKAPQKPRGPIQWGPDYAAPDFDPYA